MIDIVFPNQNEKSFVEMAKRLGCEKLVFVYPQNSIPKKPTTDFLMTAVLAEPKKALALKKSKNFVVVKSSEDDRQVIESGSADVVFGCETRALKDYAHQRASGLNHVLCKLATKNNVSIGFSFSELLEATPQQRAILIGRMQQNIRLCQKYKTPMRIASFATSPWQMRGPHDLQALFRVLGMHAAQVKKSLQNF